MNFGTMYFPAAALAPGDVIRLHLAEDDDREPSDLDVTVTAIARDEQQVHLAMTSPHYVHLGGPARATLLPLQATLDVHAPVQVLTARQYEAKTRWTRFFTESGSEYLIDHVERIWQRAAGAHAAHWRSPNGVFWRCSEIREGCEVTLVCPPVVPGSPARILRSTPVSSVTHEGGPSPREGQA